MRIRVSCSCLSDEAGRSPPIISIDFATAVVCEPLFDLLHKGRVVALLDGGASEPATVANLLAERSGGAGLAEIAIYVPAAGAAKCPLCTVRPYSSERPCDLIAPFDPFGGGAVWVVRHFLVSAPDLSPRRGHRRLADVRNIANHLTGVKMGDINIFRRSQARQAQGETIGGKICH